MFCFILDGAQAFDDFFFLKIFLDWSKTLGETNLPFWIYRGFDRIFLFWMFVFCFVDAVFSILFYFSLFFGDIVLCVYFQCVEIMLPFLLGFILIYDF